MTDNLNDNDRQRIKQEAKDRLDEYENRKRFIQGAEYEHKYQRKQQAALQTENNIYFQERNEAWKQNAQLEAERSELIQLIGDFWESYRQFNAIPDELENRILNSLKK